MRGQGLAGSCLAWQLWWEGSRDFRLVDRASRKGSSDVAAGMINPIAGKGWNPGWQLERFLPRAVSFYRRVEQETGGDFYLPIEIERRIESEKDSRKVREKWGLLEPWIDQERSGDEALWIRGGRLRTREFLDATRAFFVDYGLFSETSGEDGRVVLCEGAEGLMRLGLRHRSAKGQILTVRGEMELEHILVAGGIWVVPEGGGLFRVGATYEWDVLDNAPTEEGRVKLLEKAEEVLGAVELVEHVAGVRPILRQSQPVIGQLPCGDFIFNGLGSKGSIYAPLAARELARHLLRGEKISRDLDFQEWEGRES